MVKLRIQSEPICFNIEPSHGKFMRLAGRKFNRLNVLGYAYRKDEKHYWNCACGCGRFCIKGSAQLRKGIVSCGCFWSERMEETFVSHGMAKTKEHTAYLCAKGRCECKTNKAYPNYGGRGIKFLFTSFQQFFSEVGYAPSKGHSIDRIDVNGHYEPGNCRWVTNKEQQRNKRNNRLVTVDGVTKTAAEWEELLGLKTGKIASRIFQGRSDAATYAGNLKRKDSVYFDYKGERKTIPELMHLTTINEDTVRARIARGWTIEDALHVPTNKSRVG